MPALKLFISHSSRLDDVPHKYKDDDDNWRLLRETCECLKARYGKAIHILVDRNGLVPGDDWNRELNLWLAECQAAIVMVSKRALERSDWVAKEAAVLSWRRSLDPNFILIPVTIEGESTPDDLKAGFWGSFDMGRWHGIHVHAKRDAATIVDGIARRLGDPAGLVARCAPTPLDQLRAAIAKMLPGTATPTSLDAALDVLRSGGEDEDEVPGLPGHDQCARLLARRLLQSSVADVWACFDTFRTLLDHAVPPLSCDSVKWLFELVRPLWVNPAAAALLPSALGGTPALALCGQYLTRPGPNDRSEAYTLERYVERAWSWPQSRPFVVSLSRPDTPPEQIRAMIVEKILTPHANPESEGARRALNRETILLLIPASGDAGGAPDLRSLQELIRLARSYSKLVLVFSCCDSVDSLPDGMQSVVPSLVGALEDDAYNAECAETSYLHQRYGCHL